MSGVQYHVIAGGCRQSGTANIQYTCPTNDPTTGETSESKTCTDYENPGTYEWWLCDFSGFATNETAIAVCCAS